MVVVQNVRSNNPLVDCVFHGRYCSGVYQLSQSQNKKGPSTTNHKRVIFGVDINMVDLVSLEHLFVEN